MKKHLAGLAASASDLTAPSSGGYGNEAWFADGHKFGIRRRGNVVELHLEDPAGKQLSLCLPLYVARELHIHLGAALKGMGQ